MKKLSPIILASLLWLAQAVPAIADSLPVQPFEARYTVYGKGLPIGESVITLSDNGNGHYSMSSEAYPNKFAALLITDHINEYANGVFRNGVIYPLSYQHEHSSGEKSTTTRFSFDWKNRTLRSQGNAMQRTLPLKVGTMDPLSLHLQVMWDLKQGRKPTHYTLVDVDDVELKTYQVKLQGEQTLQTPLGDLRTVRISQSRQGSTRITTFWFAPSLGYLTVQVTQEKKGQQLLRMVIKEVKGIAAQ